jgi:hypothetical protein
MKHIKTEIRETCIKKELFVERTDSPDDTTIHLFPTNIACDLPEDEFINDDTRDAACKIDIRKLKDSEFLEIIPNSLESPAGLCNEMLNSTFWNFRCQKNNIEDARLVSNYFREGLTCGGP